MAKFEFDQFYDDEMEGVKNATDFVNKLFFPNSSYPPLKSDVITIRRWSGDTPMYAQGPSELILLNSGRNRPWQFTFQLAHELGHLAARSDLRFPRQDGNTWIEEVICGAYSVLAIRAMSQEAGPLRQGALQYLSDLQSYDHREVTADWVFPKLPNFAKATTLTPDLEKVAGYIAAKVTVAQIVADSRALLETAQPNEDVLSYLADWKARCENVNNTPSHLEKLLRQ